MKPDARTVQDAISQQKPFRSAGHEGVVALFLAAEAVRRPFEQLFAEHGELTLQQYNVLRILRGAGSEGLPTLAIAERMIEHTPGITRLLGRLEAKGLVRRARPSSDRRQVVCTLSAKGRRLVDELDGPVLQMDDESLACLKKAELATLIDLLNRIRQHRAGK